MEINGAGLLPILQNILKLDPNTRGTKERMDPWLLYFQVAYALSLYTLNYHESKPRHGIKSRV